MRAIRTTILENDVKKAALQVLNLIPGARFWRRNVIAVQAEYKGKKRFVRAGAKGQSDLWGIYRGIHCEIEVKKPGKRPTEIQEAWLDEVRALGGIAFWIDSTDDLGVKLHFAWRVARETEV